MNKYLQYNSMDFAQEQSFVRWVRKSNSDDVAFWEEWKTAHPEKKDEIEKAIALVNQITFKESNVEQDAEERVWSQIQGNILEEGKTENTDPIAPNKKSNTKIISLLRLAAVAAVAIAFLVVTMNKEFDTSVQTQFADVQTITLPDGSSVQLNSDSKLSYDSKSWSTDRKLELSGEAFFDVKKGSSFVVNTENGDVTVLGTSFNVYARGKLFDVHCLTGKVSVATSSQQTILTPNQSVSVINDSHSKQNDVQEKDSRTTWKSGIYNYKATTIKDVAKELERQLDIRISIPTKLNQKLFTGSFNSGNIDIALSEVLWPLNLKFTRDGKNVTVTE